LQDQDGWLRGGAVQGFEEGVFAEAALSVGGQADDVFFAEAEHADGSYG
jgi:hypothetical protein